MVARTAERNATCRSLTSYRCNLVCQDGVNNKAIEIFKELGITMGEAVNIFLSQVALHKGLPFEVKIPNEETKKAIEDARKGINMESISIEEMIAEREQMRR